ncbi:FxsB family cyclophane-forming radical SAM/SPASM peptide maturase [Streptomyces sp. cg28]|uniref:FxsB family cyclophane-forming radical SAM/SPASM peptide maturase n=1 Tax=Streptomyces sp. cg28 TaxID=3403457 RepID=UPI003B20D9C1
MEATHHGPQAGHRSRAAHARHAPWPYTRLDVPALRAAGHRPTPVRQFVLKVNSRCNLACTYCYVYEMGDTGWSGQPATMSAEVRTLAARRIAEHAAAHRLDRVDLVLHGGEPLLSPVADLASLIRETRAALPPYCTLTAAVQTNATLLTDDRLDALAAERVRVGVSLDGGAPEHNSRRVYRTSHRPSWPRVTRGLELLRRRPESYAGLLCVVDVEQDPVDTYRSLLRFAPPALDLLLPLAHWSSPPPGARDGTHVYGDWLTAVFDQWFEDGRRATRVRLFEEVIALLLGLPTGTEALGVAPAATAVVETDGTLELTDALKSAYDGAAVTGLDLTRHTFDDLLDHPGFAARQLGLDGLADQCRRCELLTVCGGGHYAHRFREGAGFRHPSVYCADLMVLIRHIAARLRTLAPAEPREAPC